ncbi:MAG: hypothetical protein ACOYZ7_16210 [Chloroflexota bacterium]
MSELTDFVLNAFRHAGGIVEPPAYGIHEVLLPEEAARRWGVPDFVRLTSDDAPPDVGEVVRLGYGHPLIETLAEELRTRPACAIAHITNVRLEKRGLAQLARQTIGLPNARLSELPRQVEQPALCHYVVFNFKVALITDEKREQLVSVTMNLQAGHAVTDQPQLEALKILQEETAFSDLPAATPLWTPSPPSGALFSEPILSALLERANRAAVDQIAAPLENLSRRAARHLELDRARLTEYYDGLARDLHRRIASATDSERQQVLETKLAALETERTAKMADVEAKYHLRVEMNLINLLVISQPKVLLAVQIGDRHTQIERTLFWDPLMHRLEPLVCDVCGQPGERLLLCAGGHLAHEECVAGEQCVDCKRLYCHLCADQVTHCVVCQRPVCQRSLNRCPECGRGTCREHVGLCHAADGEPMRLGKPQSTPPVEPSPAQEPATPPPSPPGKERVSSAKRQAAERARRQRQEQIQRARPEVTGQRVEVYIHPEQPVVEAIVYGGGQKEIAVRTWQLDNAGIGVWCRCEKERRCQVDGRLLEPARAAGIIDQIKSLVEELAQEYGISNRRIEWHAVSRGEMRRQPGPLLWGDWKNEEKLALVRVGYQVIYTRQFRWNEQIALPSFAYQLDVDEAVEVGHITQMATGLLHFEGVLPCNELLAQVIDLVRPGAWYSPQRGAQILAANPALKQSDAGELISLQDAAHPATLMEQKRELGFPPRGFSRLELLDAADPNAPPATEIARIGGKLSKIAGQEVDVRRLQSIFKNQPSLDTALGELASLYDVPEKLAEEWLKWLSQLWEQTPRYEFRGRTPTEVNRMDTATKHKKAKK